MPLVCISASMRYRSEVKELMKAFEKIGFEPLFPYLDVSDKNEDSAQTIPDKLLFARAHFKAIEQSAILYVYCPEGYIGDSVKLDIGYALALKKDIIFSHKTNNPTFDGYPLAFIPHDRLEQCKAVSFK